MKTKEIENFVLSKGLEPKHLFLAKGGIVKWMVCVVKNRNPRSQWFYIYVYDNIGRCYMTLYKVDDLPEDYFDHIEIERIDKETITINGSKAHHHHFFSMQNDGRRNENSNMAREIIRGC